MTELETKVGDTTVTKVRNGATYYTVTELSKMLDVHRNTIIYWIKQGYINAVQLGAAKKSPLMIHEDELEKVGGDIQSA